jgi:RNase P/RNase MRP subunit p30
MINFIIGKKENVGKKDKAVSHVKVLESEMDFDALKGIKGRIEEFYDCCLIKVQDVEKMRKFIDKASNYFSKIIVLGTSDRLNRTVLEHKKTWALLNPEQAHSNDRDYDSYKNSGLNHVLCKIASDNKKMILISLDELKNTKQLGRVMQNLRLCKKYKTSVFLVNFTDDKIDLKTLFEIKEIERVLMKEMKFK